MKQTQIDFEKGYNQAIEDVKKALKDDIDLEFILHTLFMYYPYFPSFFVKDKRTYVVIKTKYGLGYEKALMQIEAKEIIL